MYRRGSRHHDRQPDQDDVHRGADQRRRSYLEKEPVTQQPAAGSRHEGDERDPGRVHAQPGRQHGAAEGPNERCGIVEIDRELEGTRERISNHRSLLPDQSPAVSDRRDTPGGIITLRRTTPASRRGTPGACSRSATQSPTPILRSAGALRSAQRKPTHLDRRGARPPSAPTGRHQVSVPRPLMDRTDSPVHRRRYILGRGNASATHINDEHGPCHPSVW